MTRALAVLFGLLKLLAPLRATADEDPGGLPWAQKSFWRR